MKSQQNFSVINVNNNTLPIISEDTKTRYGWIPFGVYGHDDFFDAVTIAYNNSTTNAACIEGIADLIFGKGLYSKSHLLLLLFALITSVAYRVVWSDIFPCRSQDIPIKNILLENIFGGDGRS